MEYPIDCNTPSRRTEYLYRAQELLRKVHNFFVRWREEGITSAQHGLLPKKIREAYPYVPQITMEVYKDFNDKHFVPRNIAIAQEINVQRALLKRSTRWNIDVGEIAGI